jgi:predicted dehydrogenase
MKPASRRKFLGHTLLSAASASLPASAWAGVPGANSDLRLAVVGLHGKGRDHLRSFAALPGVRVVALCDVDQNVLQAATAQAKSLGATVKTFVDYRDLLAEKDIDAVSIVTPNHQHAMQAIWALQAGKHVFLEKPVSATIWEGTQLVAADRKYARILQANIQSRSSPAIAKALAWVRAGHLGRVKLARGLCYKRRESIGKTVGPQPVPDCVNYDLWLGPAEKGPLRRARLHYDWHWQFGTGNGDIANQGNHQMDVARRFLGESGLPPRSSSIGGRLGYDDDGDTPNTLVLVHEYAAAPLVFEVRGLPERTGSNAMDSYRGLLPIGNVIECEGGSIVIPSGDYSVAMAYDDRGRLLRKFSGKGNHYENFVRAVHSGKASVGNAPSVEGHVSAALSHLPNVSLELGREMSVSNASRELAGPAPLREAFDRMAHHLEQNGLASDQTRLRLGASLSIDAQTERFTGPDAERANRALTRTYRKPWVVPAIS